MDVLLCLAEDAGTVVEREELLRRVWGERAPSDEPLTRCIGELRKALGDTRAEPEFIQTIPKRGYQLRQAATPLIVEADLTAGEDEDSFAAPRNGLHKMTIRNVALGVVALIAVVFVSVFVARMPESRSPVVTDGGKSIAVLPFVNLSGDAEQEYFSNGISEEVLNLLARVEQLRVISRTSAFSFKGKDLDIPTIAAQLNVTHILEGSVRKAGDQIRITTQLIDAQTDSHIWSESYERRIDDIFATQDEIAESVFRNLKIELLGDLPTTQATNPEAYTLVLQARHIGRLYTPDALNKSVALLERAVENDPDYAVAWATLSRGYRRQASQGLRPFDESYALAREAAYRALAIDPTNVDAYRGLAFIARGHDQDFAAAARFFQNALALSPADAVTISGAGSMAASLGRLDQATALAEFAVSRDPVSPLAHASLGLVYLHGDRHDEAIEAYRKALLFSPHFLAIHHLIGLAMLHKGDLDAALAETQLEADEGYRLIGEAVIYHAKGESAAADAALAELIEKYEHDSAYNISFIYAFHGEADRAFDWLQKAVDYHDTGLSEILTEPLFDNIRTDPRWLPFLESIRKAPEQLATIDFDLSALIGVHGQAD